MQNELLKEKIESFVSTKPPVIDIIGYGSAVKTQSNSNEQIKKQIDVIATCDDGTLWHKENLKENKDEYNLLANLFINDTIYHLGTDIQYLSHLNHDDNLFKLGIINRTDLIDDLKKWKNFYMAGRFQKPVLIVRGDDELNNAIEINRLNALRTALILCHDSVVNKADLFKTICSLSYIGDIRVNFNLENPHKISNIVSGEFNEFSSIYGTSELYDIENNTIIPNYDSLFKEIDDLPECLLDYLVSNNVNLKSYTVENLNNISNLIFKYLKKVNTKSSICQPIKSVSINGFTNSKKYLKEKRKKYVLNK